MVFTLGSFTTWPASRLAFMQAAPAGSTPMTWILGLSSLARVETPVASPPPPMGTRMQSTRGRSWKISIAMVPWPQATSRSLKGCTKVRPRSSASLQACS